MNSRQIASPARARAVVVIMALAAATLLAGCSLTTPTGGTISAVIYGVLYGQVTAPGVRNGLTIQGRVYSDSADALAYSQTNGYLGGIPSILPDSSHISGSPTIYFYNAQLQSAITQVVWIDVLAEGQSTSGVVFSDTGWAVRMRLDSLGGVLGHDSIAVNLKMP